MHFLIVDPMKSRKDMDFKFMDVSLHFKAVTSFHKVHKIHKLPKYSMNSMNCMNCMNCMNFNNL
jgi:hypothetical protein